MINGKGVEKKLGFSGDCENGCAALLRDPVSIQKAEILLMESTYGDRNHRAIDETLNEFEEIIIEASKNGGNILIPSFAVGRTQEIIFYLGKLYQKGMLKQQAVYLDSPMAIAATEVYHRFQNVFIRHWAANHYIHHQHIDKNFGVTTPLWDIVLRTRYKRLSR